MVGSTASNLVKVGLSIAGAAGAAFVAHGLASRTGTVAHAQEPSSALHPEEWRSFKLLEKRTLTPNTFFFRFGLPDSKQLLGLPVASCMVARAAVGDDNEDGTKKFVIRPYTPVSKPDAVGHFDLVVKAYPEGKVSKYFGELTVGESIEVKGPIPKYPYTANHKKQIGMVAGGSGITPMLQVAYEILSNPKDTTEVSLIFANVTEEDIISRKELDELSSKHSNFKVFYVLDKAPANWAGGVGYVTKDIIQKHLPAPSEDSIVFVCGPPPMMKAISGPKVSPKDQGEVDGLLKDLGYSKDNVYKF